MWITLNDKSLNVFDFAVEVDVDVRRYYRAATYWEPSESETTVKSYSYDKAKVQREIDIHIATMHECDETDYTLTLEQVDDLIADHLNEMARTGELNDC
jgi:DNA polymerase/3'-5' exonuclease PolX